MRRWNSGPLAIACGLLALVAVLAVLQYRWLGEVSEAERTRVRAHLQQCATDVQRAFDREITRAFVTFQIDARRLDLEPAAALAAAYRTWQSEAAAPGIVDAVYLAHVASGRPAALQRFDSAAGELVNAEWPGPLVPWRDRSMRAAANLPGAVPLVPLDPIASDVPALVIGVPHVNVIAAPGHEAVVSDSGGSAYLVIGVLDRTRLRSDLLAPLVARYFGPEGASAYALSIGPRDGNSVAYATTSDGRAVPDRDADATVSLFDLQPQDLARLHTGPGPMAAREHVAITIVRRADPADVSRSLMPGAPGSGAWQLRVRHRAGSLEQIVARSRRGNLAISGAILLILSGGIVLIVVTTDRRRRLAHQQMQFVAAVSHELRTPLAVICSAADNLADGVVADPGQVRRYGALVRSEGQRLADMVERVLAFAGINARKRSAAPHGICDVAAIVADAVDSARREGGTQDVTIAVRASGTVLVQGDGGALRSAAQNIVGNAVKYSRPGGLVDVDVSASVGLATIRVADRGLGIDAADLPHVWEPFYRGRRVIEAQIRGSGIGLSIVRDVIREHGGTVSITSDATGTTVTVELPLARAAVPSGETARAIA